MVQPNNGISQGESLCREEKGQKGSLTTKELGKGKGILGETFKALLRGQKKGEVLEVLSRDSLPSEPQPRRGLLECPNPRTGLQFRKKAFPFSQREGKSWLRSSCSCSSISSSSWEVPAGKSQALAPLGALTGIKSLHGAFHSLVLEKSLLGWDEC